MKRLMIALVAVLFLLGACATVPVKPIASGDLPDLKGQWEGTREMLLSFLERSPSPILEIFKRHPSRKRKVHHLY